MQETSIILNRFLSRTDNSISSRRLADHSVPGVDWNWTTALQGRQRRLGLVAARLESRISPAGTRKVLTFDVLTRHSTCVYAKVLDL